MQEAEVVLGEVQLAEAIVAGPVVESGQEREALHRGLCGDGETEGHGELLLSVGVDDPLGDLIARGCSYRHQRFDVRGRLCVHQCGRLLLWW